MVVMRAKMMTALSLVEGGKERCGKVGGGEDES